MREDDNDSNLPDERATITFRGRRYSAVNAMGAAIVALSVAFTALVNLGLEFVKPEPDVTDRYYGRDGDRDREASEDRDASIRRDHEKDISRLSADLAGLRSRVQSLEREDQACKLDRQALNSSLAYLKERCDTLSDSIKEHNHWRNP